MNCVTLKPNKSQENAHLPLPGEGSNRYTFNSRRLHFHLLFPQLFTIQCACGHLRALLADPQHPTTDGHYTPTLSDAQVSTHLRIFLDANMNSAFFPTKHQYCTTFHKAFQRWPRAHGLPPSIIQLADT